MNRRIAKKINRRTSACVATRRPVPYTQRQVRRALHRLRQTWHGDRKETIYAYSVSYAAGAQRWMIKPAGRTAGGLRAFPWEPRMGLSAFAVGLSTALGVL